MGHPPAKCRRCGAVVAATGIELAPGSQQTTLIGGTFGPCPHCGGLCDILDGVYDGEVGAVRLISGPQATIDTLIQAGLLFQQARSAGRSEDEAIAEAASVLPSLRQLQGKVPPWVRQTVLGILLLVAQNRINHFLDEVFDGQSALTPAVAETIERKFHELQQRQRREAADRAGVRDSNQADSAPDLKLSREFPKPPSKITFRSLERLHRETIQRYRERERGRSGTAPPAPAKPPAT